jgi:hypothetical protein
LIAVLERAGFGRSGALLAGALVAFSYGFWRNGVEIEVYALSALALVACLGAALRAAERPSARAFRVLGVVSGLAILAHVANVFFAAVVLAVLVLPTAPRRGSYAYVGEYVVSGAVVVAAYGAAIVSLHLTSVHDFWDWMTFESSGGGYCAITPRRLAEAVVGLVRALVGG